MSKPDYVACMVVACGILHNLAIRNGIELDLQDDVDLGDPRRIIGLEVEEDEEVNNYDRHGNHLYIQGVQERDRIMEEYFEGH